MFRIDHAAAVCVFANRLPESLLKPRRYEGIGEELVEVGVVAFDDAANGRFADGRKVIVAGKNLCQRVFYVTIPRVKRRGDYIVEA